MTTLKNLVEEQNADKVIEKVARLIERIGQVEAQHHMRLVMINAKLKQGKGIPTKDAEFIKKIAEYV